MLGCLHIVLRGVDFWSRNCVKPARGQRRRDARFKQILFQKTAFGPKLQPLQPISDNPVYVCVNPSSVLPQERTTQYHKGISCLLSISHKFGKLCCFELCFVHAYISFRPRTEHARRVTRVLAHPARARCVCVGVVKRKPCQQNESVVCFRRTSLNDNKSQHE